ncbi:MAG: hypothetical protein JXQ87_09445 [Bacteroidia bacterium]
MLDTIEKDVLERLTFEEKLDHLLEEVNEPRPVVIDVLKGLLTKDMVQAYSFDENTGKATPTPFYDSDNMGEFMYRITTKGLDALY